MDLGSYTYSTPLAYDQWHRLGVLRDSTQLTVIRSDGDTKTYSADADTQAWWGNWACVEAVATAAGDDVAIRAFRVSQMWQFPSSALPPGRARPPATQPRRRAPTSKCPAPHRSP